MPSANIQFKDTENGIKFSCSAEWWDWANKEEMRKSLREATNGCLAYYATQVHGGYGYSGEYPVERYYRDVKVATLLEGTSQMHKLI